MRSSLILVKYWAIQLVTRGAARGGAITAVVVRELSPAQYSSRRGTFKFLMGFQCFL